MAFRAMTFSKMTISLKSIGIIMSSNMMTLGIMTPRTTTVGIMTWENTMTLENSNQTSIMAHRTMTLSIMTLNKMPLCKMVPA